VTTHSQLRLTVALRKVLTAAAADPGHPLTLGLIIDTTAERAFGVLMAFLCLPFVQPIPVPGLSIPFGLALMLLGAQIAIRKHRPWLPQRMLRLKLPRKAGTRIIGVIARIFNPLEKIVRPRLLFMQNPIAIVFVGLALLFDGLLLVALPAFPGSNFIPGWMALIKILGITEEDGIALIAGTLLSALAFLAGVTLLILGWHHLAAWWT
jgi:hypothetical protein